MNKEMDAIYILSPLPHIVDCLMTDFERRWYKRAFVIWTSGSSLRYDVVVEAQETHPLTPVGTQSYLEISVRDWNNRQLFESSSLSSGS